MRWLGILLVVALLALGWVGFSQPERFPGVDMVGLVWAAMTLLLVTGAAYGFWRFREHKGAALAGVVFWTLAIVALVWGYETFN